MLRPIRRLPLIRSQRLSVQASYFSKGDQDIVRGTPEKEEKEFAYQSFDSTQDIAAPKLEESMIKKFKARKNQAISEQNYGSLLTSQLYNWQYYSRGGLPDNVKQDGQRTKPWPLWVVHDGPAFANGKSHLGHMANKVIKDVINRYKLLRGFRVHFVPGFDCFGNHVQDTFEHEAEAKAKIDQITLKTPLPKDRHLSGKEEHALKVREAVRESVEASLMVQMNELQQWGIMADWRYSYFTMQPDYQAMVLESFAHLLENNLVYWGQRPALWSVEEQRILAEEEFDFKTEVRDSVVLKLPIKNFGKKAENIQKLYPDAKVLVFATEPWKVTGMQGVSINEGIVYSLAKWRGEYVIAASKRLGELMLRTGSKFNKLLNFEGEVLDEMVLEHPILNQEVPVIVHNDVSQDFGTGLQAVIPAHHMNDVAVGIHYNLPMEGYVTKAGTLSEDLGGHLAGLSIFDEKTNEYLVQVMQEENKVLCQFRYQNEYCENTKTGERVPLMTLPSWQFNIDDQLQMESLNELASTKFLPKLNHKSTEQVHTDQIKMKKGEKVQPYYINVAEELSDFNQWCISDTNEWGIPIPQFIRKDTGQPVISPEIVNHFGKLVAEHGTSDIWFSMDIVDLLPPKLKHQAEKLEKDYMVFDSWFDSSLSWRYVLQDQQSTPKPIDLHHKHQIFNHISESVGFQKALEKLKEEKAAPRRRGRRVGNRKAPEPSTTEGTLPEFQVRDLTKPDSILTSFSESTLQQVEREDMLSFLRKKAVAQRNWQLSDFKDTVFPANLYFEGCDQHTRWFLLTCLTSTGLIGRLPFMVLKTQGLLLDKQGEKMSKSVPQYTIDPEDLIYGSIKLDGERKHGFGADAMRLWCAQHDTDQNFSIELEDIQKCNAQVKHFRLLCRSLLRSLENCMLTIKGKAEKPSFQQLSIVDKMMQLKTMQFMDDAQKIMDKKLSTKEYIAHLEEFLLSPHIQLYLEFAATRSYNCKHGNHGDEVVQNQALSMLFTVIQLLKGLMMSASPIMIYTCQDLFEALDPSLFDHSIKPKTVFQMPWPMNDVEKLELLVEQAGFLTRFELRNQFELMLNMRERVGQALKQRERTSRISTKDKEFEIVFKEKEEKEIHFQDGKVKKAEHDPDSDIATMLEGVLEDDIEDFFFGQKVTVVGSDSKYHKGRRSDKVTDQVFILY